MADNEDRHQREMKAALNQIKRFQTKASKEWRIGVPIWKLSCEGLAVFSLAFMTGLGLAVLYQLVLG